LQGAEAAPDGKLRSILLEDDRKLTADFFVDASGFRSELLGGFYQEEFVSFRNSLFCDRAVAGGWKRTNEPILPYTTAETMNAGWAWQIEHEHHINRGYVYSSESISDEQAVEEFCRKNPLAPREPRLIKFRSGYYRRQWRENVVAIGNAGGFVEPLEATALMIVCGNVQMLVEMLQRSHLQPSPTMRSLFNRMAEKTWLDIRDFLALHYKFNTLVDTEFWRRCREQTDVSGIQDLIDYYRENGPTGFCRYLLSGTQNDFGLEGYLVMLVGMGVPYEHQSKLSEAERLRWQQYQQTFSSQAMQAMDVKEALGYVHHPQWQWNGD
jgi:tryptophan halogenase